METVIAALLRQFAQDGDPARLFLLGGSQDATWLEGLPVARMGSPLQSKMRRYMRYLFALPRQLRQFDPQLILCADPRSVMVAAVLKRVLRMDTRVASWMHFALAQLEGTRWLRHADLHLAISTGVAEDLRAAGMHNIHTVFNPVPTADEDLPRAAVATFLHLGRLTMGGQKRSDDFLRALAGLNGNFAAVIVGTGADEGALRQLAQELGIAAKLRWLWMAEPTVEGDAPL